MFRRDLRRLGFIIALVVVAVLALVVNTIDIGIGSVNFQRGDKEGPLGLTLGLDLQGGVQLIYEAQDQNVTKDQMEGVKDKIERRTNSFGVTEPSIQILGSNRILIQLPGVEDVEEAKRLIGQTAQLEFKERICAPAGCDETQNAGATINAVGDLTADATTFPVSDASVFREGETLLASLEQMRVTGTDGEANTITVLRGYRHTEATGHANGASISRFTFEDRDIGLTGELLTRAYAGTHATTGQPIVHLEFNGEGAKKFGDTTARIAGTNNRTAIFLDNEELVAPVASQAILGGQAFIQGPDFTFDSVRTIAIQLEGGRLDTPIVVIQEQNVDATLGEDALDKSLVAGLIGFGLVALFMVLYYRIPGVTAVLALVCYIVLVLLVIKLIPVTMTLAGIAGFILSIGVAVDANILISERTKEELRTGRALLGAIETGYSRAWPAILNSNVATMITCVILFWFGSRFGASAVTGFSITLFIGVATSMFTAVVISHTFLRLIASTPLSRFTGMFTPVPGQVITAGAGRRSHTQRERN
jgi:preprotein translocase subunit SecD